MINLKTKSKENKKCVFALKEPSGVMTIVITPPVYMEGTWDIGCCATTTRKIGLDLTRTKKLVSCRTAEWT